MSPTPAQDEQYLRRAIRLAMNGRGGVEPNPMVGCVLVKDDRVVGEGNHAHYGGPHAEPTALAHCTESPEGATAYVTLEPCCHTNKQTPPCAPRLIEAKIARVVIGCLDPNPDVNGKGVSMLRAAGIEVDGPVLEAASKQLIAPFLKGISPRRPYVTLKWAQTADGKVAGPGGARLQISGGPATRLVHALRAKCDVILVGVNTVLSDDPLLTSRDVPNARPLLRIVLDRQLRIPADSRLVKTAKNVPLLVRTENEAYQARERRSGRLSSLGVDVRPSRTLTVSDAITDLRWLPGHRSHLLIEPGPTLAAACFSEGVPDRVWVIESKTVVNDASAPSAVPIPSGYVKTGECFIGQDRLTEYLNPASPVYFSPEPSADFVLAAEGVRG